MSYKIMQLQHNGHLLSWYKIKTYAILPESINPSIVDGEEILDMLEDLYCHDLCAHDYKILDHFDIVLFTTRVGYDSG